MASEPVALIAGVSSVIGLLALLGYWYSQLQAHSAHLSQKRGRASVQLANAQ